MKINMDGWTAELSFPKTIDNTILSSWATCKRKCFFSHFLHLHPKQISIHLHAGAAYAKALETLRDNFYTVDSDAYKNSELSLTRAVRALFESFGYDESYDAYAETTNKSCERLVDALIAYVKHHPLRTDGVQPLIGSDGKVMTEQSYTMPLEMFHPDTQDPILYHGRADMVVEFMGEPFLYDDKTTSQLGATWINKWDFRSQFDAYTLGFKKSGVDTVGTIIRGHCFLKNEVKFMDAISRRQQWQLDQWFEDAHQILFEMIMYYNRAKEMFEAGQEKLMLYKLFPATGRFNEACSAYAGCEFKALCESQHIQRRLADYRIRVWDPTNPERSDT